MPMKVIYKYCIAILDSSYVAMPKDAEILSVGVQESRKIVIWAIVDSEALIVQRRIHLRGTGHEAPPDSARHLGTVMDDPFVWHVFDGGEVVG